MIKPKAMSRLTVFGPKSYMKGVIDKLYEMNAVHIEDFTKKTENEVFDIGEPLELNERYSEQLVSIRTLISALSLQKKENIEPAILSFENIESKTKKIREEVNTLLEKKTYFSSIKKIYSTKSVDKSLAALKIELPKDFSESDYSLFLGYIFSEQEALKDEIEKITKKYLLFSGKFEGSTLIALFCDKKKKEKVHEVLSDKDFSPVDSPVIKNHFKDLKSESGHVFVKLNHEAELIEKSLQKIEPELQKIRIEHSDFLLGAEKKLKIETDKAAAPLKFATTKNTFMVKGWVPTENAKKLEEELNKITEKKVMFKLEKVKNLENVPTAFNHPKIVEPFEAFMDLYSLPSYKEIDPTFFMFLTFPIFFGFMLGDVGYGLVCLGLFILLKKKMPGMKHFLNALILSAIVSVIFGMVFGEYFGYEEVSPGIGKALGIHPEKIIMHGETEIVYEIPHLFGRSKGINDLLSVAILFGIVHIFIGFIIGFINIYKAHGLKHAIYEKGGWMLIFPLMVWLLINFLGIIRGFVADMLSVIIPKSSLIVLGVMFFIGLILVVKGEGIRGLIEVIFMGLLSNILSYARLMAVGLASLSFAMVINKLAGQMFASGIIGIFAGILILLLGHGINIALGILSPFLHSLRLHYVEFFGKFFHGGGKKFKSFGFSE